VEVLLSAAAALEPVAGPDLAAPTVPAPPPVLDHPSHYDPSAPAVGFDPTTLVDHDLLADLPPDLPALLALLPRADLYVQDEIDVKLHPTLTRLWSRRGRAGQRKVRAPGQNRKVVAGVAADWRDGWTAFGFGLGRTADLFVAHLDALVARSQARGRIALVVTDNARIHTARGAKRVREALDRHGDALPLVYTPAYDPEANPTERLFPPLRRAVTHNHHRDTLLDLYADLETYCDGWDRDPQRVLRHLGSPFAELSPTEETLAA
jgi:transposase